MRPLFLALLLASSGCYDLDMLPNLYKGGYTQLSQFSGQLGGGGYVEGPRPGSRIDSPRGICLDSDGNIYVVDSTARTLSKVGLDGSVTRVAGIAYVEGGADGGLGASTFLAAAGMRAQHRSEITLRDRLRRIDAPRVQLLDANAHHAHRYRSREIRPARRASRVSGNPAGVAVSGAFIYLTDTLENNIRIIVTNNGNDVTNRGAGFGDVDQGTVLG